MPPGLRSRSWWNFVLLKPLVPNLKGLFLFFFLNFSVYIRVEPIKVCRRAWQPTLVFWPGEFNALSSLMGYSP